MNIFYTPPSEVYSSSIELTGQEFRHAARVMRYRVGDEIVIVDGAGGRYVGTVAQMTDSSLRAEIKKAEHNPASLPKKVLALGVIKKRDRLEFAVEKAVELGVSEIALFRSRHTVKENVRMDRLESTALAAMKQSLRSWLPKIHLFEGVEDLLGYYADHKLILAHKTEDPAESLASFLNEDKLLMLVGPEGGFSKSEIDGISDRGASTISLGSHRLRSETAAITLLSRLL